MRILLLVFLTCYTATSSASESSLLESIFYSDIDQLVKLSKEGSCEANAYLAMISTKKMNVTGCETKEKDIEENLVISAYSKLVSSSRFPQAKSFYLRLPQRSNSDTDWIVSFLDLASLGDFKSKNRTMIFSHDFLSNLTVSNSTESFLLDSGAAFSLYNTKNDISEDKNGYVISAFGGKTEMHYSLFEVNKSGKHIFFKNNHSNIIGHDLMSKFRYAVLASHNSYLKNGFHYYHESNNIFINGILRIAGSEYKNVNSCIDTGGNKSVITPKLYRRIRESIKSEQLISFKFLDISGEKSTNARLVQYAEVQFGKKIFKLHAVPALFGLDISSTCDVILGRDVLSGVITAFDFDNQIIYFN